MASHLTNISLISEHPYCSTDFINKRKGLNWIGLKQFSSWIYYRHYIHNQTPKFHWVDWRETLTFKFKGTFILQSINFKYFCRISKTMFIPRRTVFIQRKTISRPSQKKEINANTNDESFRSSGVFIYTIQLNTIMFFAK